MNQMSITNRYEMYIVGGYVRDKLLGIESKDIDFCFVINKEPNEYISIENGFQEMKQWLCKEGFTIFLETPTMLTIRAKFPQTQDHNKMFSTKYINTGLTADFVLARKEVYLDPNSRQPVVELGTLYDDLERRDFTVNAMAYDLNGNLIDLFNGIADLNNCILKTPIDPCITMKDDPLRVLRAMRFCVTKDFTISNELNEAISNNIIIEKLFNVVSKDRIREELHKMFKYSTVKTINLLVEYDKKIPNFLKNIFDDNMWLKPTNSSK